MKRFILGTMFGVLTVAILVTFIPDRAHQLVDQAGDVRVLIEDVAARLEQLENISPEKEPEESEEGTVEFSEFRSIDFSASALQPAAEPEARQIAAVESAPESIRQNAIHRQSIDFDNLANGLARVTGALEKLNRTMKPGSRKNRENSSSDESNPRSGS